MSACSVPVPDLLRAALPEPAPSRVAGIRKPFRWHAILDGLSVARADPKMATPALSRWFRKSRKLGSRDRKVVQNTVLDIIRHEFFLIRAGGRGDEGLLETWCRVLEGERFEHLEAGRPAEDLSTALSLGFRVAREWLDTLGPHEAAEFARLQATRAPTYIRANALLCTRDELAARLAEEGVPTEPQALSAGALKVMKRTAFHTLESFRAGWFEVQDPSSQAFVDAIPLKPGQTVVDVCAGAGGKSLALAARGADVRAWDIRDSALNELEKRARRAHAPVRIAPPEPADVVVVDAPCSGTGRLRREPALRWRFLQGQYNADQAQLLTDAAELVRPGGVLAYATCSLLNEENSPQWVVPDGWECTAERVLWPHRDHCDGFGWRIWKRPS